MSKLMLATAVGAVVAMTGSTAMATDINQILGATQTALNSISIDQNDDGPTSQTGVNAANLVNFSAALHHVNQLATGDQTAINTVFSEWGHWHTLTQSATNIANSLSLANANGKVTNADNVGFVNQDTSFPWFGATDQYAKNVASYKEDYKGAAGYDPTITDPSAVNYVAPSQSAVNAIDLVSVNDIEGGVNQDVSGWSSQKAINKIEVSQIPSGANPPSYLAAGGVSNANQVATNVANSVNAKDVGVISQQDNGPQLALNRIEFGIGGTSYADLLNSSQAATNVSNTATIDTLNYFSSQQSDQSQKAINVADYVNANYGIQWTDGSVSGFTQTGTNATNILTASSLPSVPFLTEVQQTAIGSQLVKNVLNTAGGISGVTQTATNIANSLSLPSSN